MKKILIYLIIAVITFSSGCSINRPLKNNFEGKSSKIQVYASFYPLYFAVQEIGRDKVDLYSVIPNGVEPHDYEPTIRETARIENADLFIYNGADMEPWGDKLAKTLRTKNIAIINASEQVDLLRIDEDEHHDSHHRDEENHVHGNYDPHLWLNPLNMDKIGYAIKEQLSSADNVNKDFYENNYRDFSNKLRELDNKYTKELKNKKRDTILVSHEAFNYLSSRYEFKQISVSGVTPHEEPTPKTLANLIDLAVSKDFKYIFLEVLASPKTAEMLAKEADLKVLVLNPIAGLTEEQQEKGENYFTLMEQNLENIKKELVQ